MKIGARHLTIIIIILFSLRISESDVDGTPPPRDISIQYEVQYVSTIHDTTKGLIYTKLKTRSDNKAWTSNKAIAIRDQQTETRLK